MARMLQLPFNRFTRTVGVSLLGLAMTGCVSQEKYNALKLDRDGLADQLATSQRDGSSARAEADSYKGQLAALMNGSGSLQGLVTNLQQQNATLQAQYDELNRKYSEAMSRPGTAAALPPELNNALRDFASANPELVEFDQARGMVKFKSDVLFAAGDAAINPASKAVIDKFATILNSSAASSYELVVAGHTDNQRVSNQHTIAMGHKDNWYLSAHRAIAVGDELLADHVAANRLGVTGYADQRPVVPNDSAANQAKNRRVEVLILSTQVHGAPVMAASTSEGHPAPKKAPAKPAFNKDSAPGSIPAAAFNK